METVGKLIGESKKLSFFFYRVISFFVFVFLFDWLFSLFLTEKYFIYYKVMNILSNKKNVFLPIFMISSFIILGQMSIILRQVFMYDKIKDDYLNIIGEKYYIYKIYKKLRELAVEKLKNMGNDVINKLLKDNEKNDYLLYQILGSKYFGLNPKTDKNSIDAVSDLGLNFLNAGIMVSLIYLCFISDIFVFIIIVFIILYLVLIKYFLIPFITKRYISRNIKLYINFLLNDLTN